MARAAPVELDFLGVHDSSSSAVTAHPPYNHLHRRRSFYGISKINPKIVKSVIASAAAKPEADAALLIPASPHPVSSPAPYQNYLFKPHPFTKPYFHEKTPETAPFTIFYKGTVSVFDLPKEKVEDIIKFAAGKVTDGGDGEVDVSYLNFKNNEYFLDDDGDLPLKRKRSLHRFFEKRRERLISVYTPYPIDHVHVAPLYYKTSV